MNTAAIPAEDTVAIECDKNLDPLPLRKRFIRASLWTVLGTHGGQFIRLASNLVLTRLLFPEAFGLMAVTQLVIQGLNLFSDLGVQVSLVQDARGNDRSFVNTAWTLQVIRGVMLWMATCGVGAILYVAGVSGALPAHSAFADPQLVWMLPVVGLTCIAAGFNSTKLVAMRRRLTVGYEVIYNVAVHLLNVVIMITWAWFHPTVWALAAGGVVAAILATIGSHLFLPGESNRFAWDRQCASDLIRFGRFIFVSTIFTFVGMNAQRAMLGTIMTPETFGIFAIALVMLLFVVRALERMYQNVLFPLYSELVRRRNPEGLGRTIARVRCWLLALTLPPMWGLVIGGPWIIRLLYDSRYHEAGWMLQILSVAAIATLLSQTIESIMLAHGDSRRHLLYTASSTVVVVICMVIGGFTASVAGILIGTAAGKFVQHIMLYWFIRSYGVGTPRIDIAAVAISAAVIAAGCLLFPA